MICYDLENNRLREKTAKTLIRYGCIRLQKSVFVAANLEKRDLDRMENDLKNLLLGHSGRGDSLVVVPLRDEHVKEIRTIASHNNTYTYFEPEPLKIVL